MTKRRKIVRRSPEQVYKKWIKALRSGEYSQTVHRLRRESCDGTTRFCCLGVLCDLAVKDGGGTGKGWSSYNSVRFPDPENKTSIEVVTSPPDVMMEYLGIGGYQMHHLITMNDNLEKSFSEIADYIEQKIMPKALEQLNSNLI